MKRQKSVRALLSLLLTVSLLIAAPLVVLAEMLNTTPSEAAEQPEPAPSEAAEQPEPAPSEAAEQPEIAPSETAEQPEIAPSETAEPVLSFEFYLEGVLLDTQFIRDGEYLVAPDAPFLEGKKFIGWFVPAEENRLLLFDQPVSVTCAATVYVEARFEEIVAEEGSTSSETPTENVLETEIAPTEPDAAEGEEESDVGKDVQPERSISISSSQGEVVQEAEIITLTAVLTGFADVQVLLQWQYFDGEEWLDAEGGDALIYRYEADEIRLAYLWRLKVDIVPPETAE